MFYYKKQIPLKKYRKNNFKNVIYREFKKGLFVLFFLLNIFLSFEVFAQEMILDKEKNYFISQSIKFGKDSFKNVFFSPDEQHLIALSSNSSIEVIRIKNSKKVRVISTREQKAISLLPHPDGKVVITGGEDETIKIWDTILTSSKDVLRGHLSPVSHLTLYRGGEILASGSHDGTIFLWNLKKNKLLNSLKISGKDGIKSLVFHPEEKFLIVGGKNGKIQIRSVPDLKLISNLAKHKKTVVDMEFNNRGDIFVTGSKDKKVIIWNWKDKKIRFVLDIEDAISDLKINPRKKEVAVATMEGRFEIWDLEKGTKINLIKRFEDPINHIEFDNNGRRILTALDDGSIHIWEYRHSLYLNKLKGHERPIEAMDFSMDSKRLISSGSEKSVFIWDLEKNKNIKKFDMGKHRVQEVQFIPKSMNFVTAGSNGYVKVWSFEDGQLIRDLKFHEGKINSLSFHPKEDVLLSAGSDRNWVLWNLESGERQLTGSGHSSQILSAKFSPDGNIFATAGSDLSIIIWNFPEGKELARLKGHKKAITSLDLSPDGKYLASGSMDNRIIFWKIKPEVSKKPYRVLKGHDFIVSKVMFSKKGKKLISVSKDKTMRLWDVKSGQLLRILHGDSMPLFSSSLSPNGELIALSNLSKDILLFKFPNENNKLAYNSGVYQANGMKKTSFNNQDIAEIVNDNKIIDLDDLQVTDSNLDSELGISAYAIPTSSSNLTNYIEMQNELNQLLKQNITCKHAFEIETLALEILKEIPNDLAAYHSLVKVSIMKGDFNILKLLLEAANLSQLDTNRYNYISLERIKTFIEDLRVEVFDQSFLRRGNLQKVELSNCMGEFVPFNLTESSQKLFYPKEFLEIFTKRPRMLDLRDFMELDSKEFQNRIFKEIDRVIENGDPYHPSRVSRTSKEISETIPYGKVNINFEKVQTFKGNGKVIFLLRKERGKWKTFSSDMDNHIEMNLQAGRYYLKVSDILRKTFTLVPGTNVNIILE